MEHQNVDDMMTIANTCIELKNIKIYAYHGVMPQENTVGSYYYIDLKVKTDFTKAALYDNLNETVNYAEIYQRVVEVMHTPSKLIEHVAKRLAERLLNDFERITQIDIRIAKENPPFGADNAQVSISASFKREN